MTKNTIKKVKDYRQKSKISRSLPSPLNQILFICPVYVREAMTDAASGCFC